MAFFETAGRIGATLGAMAATRLELAAVEVQQEARRLIGCLAWTVLASSLAGGAILLAALFVVLLFWDSYRLQAVAAMAMLLAAGAAVLSIKVRAALDARPPLLSATLAELRKDFVFVRTVSAADDGAPQPEALHD